MVGCACPLAFIFVLLVFEPPKVKDIPQEMAGVTSALPHFTLYGYSQVPTQREWPTISGRIRTKVHGFVASHGTCSMAWYSEKVIGRKVNMKKMTHDGKCLKTELTKKWEYTKKYKKWKYGEGKRKETMERREKQEQGLNVRRLQRIGGWKEEEKSANSEWEGR